MCTLIPGRLAFGPAGSSSPPQVRLAFKDITASEFRRGRYEVCHFQRRDLGAAMGPLAMDQTLWFAHELHLRLQDETTFVVVEYAREERRNAAALVGAYLVLALGWSAKDVCQAMSDDSRMKFPCSWIHPSELNTPQGAPRMYVKDCWEGVQMARELGWLQSSLVEDGVKTSLAATKFWKTSVEYDGAWLVPGRVLVMADPVTTIVDPDPSTCRSWTSAELLKKESVEDELWEPLTPRPGAPLMPGVPDAPLSPVPFLVPEGEEKKQSSKEYLSSSQSTRVDSEGSQGCDAACDADDDNDSVFTVCKDYTRSTPLPNHGSAELWPEPKPMAEFLNDEGVSAVVRANTSTEPGLVEIGGSYDPEILAGHGIHHADFFISDTVRNGNGAVPSNSVIRRFLQTAQEMRVEAGEGATCIHCKGGFGRSVMLAAILMVHEYDVPGRSVLGWVRIARPGAITTPQQEAFLCALRGRADLCRKCGLPCPREDISEHVNGGVKAQGCCTIS